MSYLQFEQIGRSESGKTRIIAVRDRSGGSLVARAAAVLAAPEEKSPRAFYNTGPGEHP